MLSFCCEERQGAYRIGIAPGRGAFILFNLRTKHSPASLLPATSRCVEEYPVRSMAWRFDKAVQSALGETVLIPRISSYDGEIQVTYLLGPGSYSSPPYRVLGRGIFPKTVHGYFWLASLYLSKE